MKYIIIVIMVFFIFAVGNVIAQDVYSDCSVYGNCIEEEKGTTSAPIDNSSLNVNDTQFLRGYFWDNAPYPLFLNATFNSTYDNLLKAWLGNYTRFVPYVSATQDVILGENNLSMKNIRIGTNTTYAEDMEANLWLFDSDNRALMNVMNNNSAGRSQFNIGMTTDPVNAGGAQFSLRAHGSDWSETLFDNPMANSVVLIGQPQTSGVFAIGTYETYDLVFGTTNQQWMKFDGTTGKLNILNHVNVSYDLNASRFCNSTECSATIFKGHTETPMNYTNLAMLNQTNDGSMYLKSVNKTGTGTLIDNSDGTMQGVGTLFTKELRDGAFIIADDCGYYQVINVTNDTLLNYYYSGSECGAFENTFHYENPMLLTKDSQGNYGITSTRYLSAGATGTTFTAVGIGTTNPQAMLHIKNKNDLVVDGLSGTPRIVLENPSTTNSWAEFQMKTDISDVRIGAGGSGTSPYYAPAGSAYLGQVQPYAFVFATNNVVRFFISGQGEEINVTNVRWFNALQNASVGQVLKLKPIGLPGCSNYLKNSFGANDTGTYGCNGSCWGKANDTGYQLCGVRLF